MRLLIILFLCCGSFMTAFGQQNLCYDEQLREGDAFEKEGLFQKAIDSWKSGINRCGPTDSQLATLKSRIEKAENQLKSPQPIVTTPTRQPYEPDMVFVQDGTFTMGSENGESDEKPTHSVTLSPFFMAKYELTVEQFAAFIKESSYITTAEQQDSSYIYDGSSWKWKRGVNWRHDENGNSRSQSEYNHPVIHVSWYDATKYCEWLSQRTGKKYRLPTEAEWEYAAGNGSKHTKFSWGDGNPSSSKGGSVADESGAKKFNWSRTETNIFMNYDDGYPQSAPVGSFSPNDFGLYDMSGNVWEWCSDWYGNYSSDKQKNPTGISSGSNRVIRGGSWLNLPTGERVTYRLNDTPAYRNGNVGFRVVRSPQ